MRAALELLGAAKPGPKGRRIAVIGDMLELGPKAEAMHAELAADLSANRVDLLFGAGPLTRALYDAAPASMRAAWAERSNELDRRSRPRLARRRRRDGQRLQRQPDGSAGRGAARPLRPRAREARTFDADLAGRASRRIPPLPLSHLPHARRGGDRAVSRLLLRPDDHLRAAAQAGQGPADPRRRPPLASSHQKGHADDGRPDDPVRPLRLRAAVGQSRKPLCVDRAVRHRRLRRDRLLRRLSEGDQAVGSRLFRPRAPRRRISSSRRSPATR